MSKREHRLFQRSMLWMLLAAAALAALAAAVVLIPGSTAPDEAPPAQAADNPQDSRVQDGCDVHQTLTYTRCQHTVTRRVTAPVELLGKTHEEAEKLYPEWRITAFGPKRVEMEQQMDLFCPDHRVLLPGGDGLLCVFENRYGDALSLVKELQTPLSALPEAQQQLVKRGMGFSTLEELEAWLESMES